VLDHIEAIDEDDDEEEAYQEPIRCKMNAYTFFNVQTRPVVMTENPELDWRNVAIKVGRMWRELSDTEKEPFTKLAADDEARYNQETKEREETRGTDSNSVAQLRKPLTNPYTLFNTEQRKKVMAENPDLSFAEAATLVGKMWQNITPEEKALYELMVIDDQKRYQEQLEELKQQGREKTALKDKEAEEKWLEAEKEKTHYIALEEEKRKLYMGPESYSEWTEEDLKQETQIVAAYENEVKHVHTAGIICHRCSVERRMKEINSALKKFESVNADVPPETNGVDVVSMENIELNQVSESQSVDAEPVLENEISNTESTTPVRISMEIDNIDSNQVAQDINVEISKQKDDSRNLNPNESTPSTLPVENEIVSGTDASGVPTITSDAPMETDGVTAVQEESEVAIPVKRGRGRPRKYPASAVEAKPEKDLIDDEDLPDALSMIDREAPELPANDEQLKIAIESKPKRLSSWLVFQAYHRQQLVPSAGQLDDSESLNKVIADMWAERSKSLKGRWKLLARKVNEIYDELWLPLEQQWDKIKRKFKDSSISSQRISSKRRESNIEQPSRGSEAHPKFTGVFSIRGRWKAELVCLDKEIRTIGRYETDILAALAFDQAVRYAYPIKIAEAVANFPFQETNVALQGQWPDTREFVESCKKYTDE